MAKITYSSLKLKTNDDVKIIDFNGNKIEILKYLPIDEKYNLIEITLQKAYENGIYNPLKLDMYFSLNLVYLYSNINFTDKQREDEEKLYDTLQSNGLLDIIIDTIEDDEYNNLYTLLMETEEAKIAYRKSLLGIVDAMANTIENDGQKLNEIVNQFDPNQFKNVLEFAQAANGNRPIE